MKNKWTLKFLNYLPFLVVFLASIYNPSDPDLGWHLKYGEYFLKTGKVLRDNLFSSTMSDYHWVNHSWGSDIITYFVYYNFDFFGLSILSAIIITFTFYFFSKAARLSQFDKALIFPLILYFMIPLNLISFRPQLISLLFSGILIFLLSKYKESKRFLYFIPILFLLWANIHGEFILGIAIFALWILLFCIYFYFEKIKSLKKEFIFFLIIFLISILVCLINPFGIGIFREAFNHFGNPAQGYIAEWATFEELSNLWWNLIIVAILMLMGCIYGFASGKIKKIFPFVGVSIILLILSFWERRYAWPAYYFSIFLLAPVSEFFSPNSKKYQNIASSVIIIITLIIVVFYKLPFSRYTSMSWNIYCNYLNCSPNSAKFLSQYKYKGRLLTLYNWGGWLIWNYPEIKPSIDGRMPFWRGKNGYSAFLEYYYLEQNWKEIDKSKYNTVYIGNFKPIYNRMIQLVNQEKWKMVYQDKVSGIFVRNQ